MRDQFLFAIYSAIFYQYYSEYLHKYHRIFLHLIFIKYLEKSHINEDILSSIFTSIQSQSKHACPLLNDI